MLTVDFERLYLRDRERLLDLGCGGGRHAFEAMRRGAMVVALDADDAALKDAAAVSGDALTLPFPDESFDRIIAAEVLEHIPGDERAIGELVRVLRPGGRMAVTVPTRWPERICWALDYRYHDIPGGHVRIYRQPELEAKLQRAGLLLRGSHHAHALHSPYWMLKCAVGVDNADALPVRKYHDFLVWELTKRPRWSRLLDRTLNPVLGKSLVVYTEKPE